MSHGPYAIGELDSGLKVFVENACPGDELAVEIYDEHKNFAFANISETLSLSPLRNLDPKCKLHKICGGCQWQHIDYAQQLRFKRDNIRDLIIKSGIDTKLLATKLNHEDPMIALDQGICERATGHLSEGEFHQSEALPDYQAKSRHEVTYSGVNEHTEGNAAMDDFATSLPAVLGMDEPWHYRNKIIYPVETVPQTKRLLAGYYKRKSHELVNIKYCPIQYEIFDAIMTEIKDLCSERGIGKPLLRHIALRANIDQSQVLVTFIIRPSELNADKKSTIHRIFQILHKKFPQIKACSLNYNNLSTNVIFGKRTETLTGEQSSIIDQLGDIQLSISPASFFQINNSQFLKIIKTIKDFIDIQDGDRMLDAYCGIGTISLSLAKGFPQSKIEAIEVIDSAIEDAKTNAKLNEINNVNFKLGQVEDHIGKYAQGHFKLVIINPPRKGCTNKVLGALGVISAPKIIYVSCNPATLTRDIKYLEQYGYRLAKIQPVDLFPHTFHVETVALLELITL
jgi:23S rRNA (uracil1939-C5)-methyltransferase